MGVYDHIKNPEGDKIPNIGSTVKPETNIELVNPYYNIVDSFIALDIHEKTGLSINEFLQLPAWQHDYIMLSMQRQRYKETKQTENIDKALKKSVQSVT